MARFSWASFEMLPNDIAPVAKRFTSSVAGSTSSSGTGARSGRSSHRCRSVTGASGEFTSDAYSSYDAASSRRTAR